MKISACIIARNEERDISVCLKSLQHIVDEIIVVDTGSMDKTSDIAKKYSAKVYSFKWNDDFSEVKNYALEKAIGDWVIFLDADESISPDSRKNIRPLLQRQALNCEGILCKMINIDADNENQMLDFFYTVRIFRNLPKLRYRGIVHEQIGKVDGTKFSIQKTESAELVLYHTGYSTGRIKGKCERNIVLLQKRLQNGEQTALVYRSLAEAYATLESYEMALLYLRKVSSLPLEHITYGSRFYHIYLVALKETGQTETKEFMAVLQQALERFPDLPDFRAEYGLYLYQVNHLEEAKVELKRAFELQRGYSGMEPSFFERNMPVALQLLESIKQSLNRKRENCISACVIVRNEEKNILRWLRSMQRIVDEIIVVDTGSTDRTVELLNEQNIRVEFFAWRDDFSAAKNFAISKASMDWIFLLDADEYFTEESYTALQRMKQSPELFVDYDAILGQQVNVDCENKVKSVFYQVRIFRNRSDIRYQGTIHERLVSSHGELKIKKMDEVQFLHTGYMEGLIEEKAQRNLKLLLPKLVCQNEAPYYYAYICDAYFALGAYEETIQFAHLHLTKGKKSATGESKIYRNLIFAMEHLQQPAEEIIDVCRKAICEFPELPDFYVFYAEQLCHLRDFKNALKKIKRAFLVYEQGDRSKTFESSIFLANISAIYTIYAEAALESGALFEAEKMVKNALKAEKYNLKAFKVLMRLLDGKSLADKLTVINTIYSEEADWSFLIKMLQRTQVNEIYFHFARLLAGKERARLKDLQRKKSLMDRAYQDVSRDAKQFLGYRLQEFVFCLLNLNQWEKCVRYCKILPEDYSNLVQAFYDKCLLHEGGRNLAMRLLPVAENGLCEDTFNRFCEKVAMENMAVMRVKER